MHLRDCLEFLLHDRKENFCWVFFFLFVYFSSPFTVQHMEHFAGSESYHEQVGFFASLCDLQPSTRMFFELCFPGGRLICVLLRNPFFEVGL